ncbi:MAG TPA: C4-type zinc ribbon domain-containing protein [Ktedonobacteraceae bacterium]|nr:C4-type zinc ribbon domain-containing protein [Ktedonobacteraceae bacterium]
MSTTQAAAALYRLQQLDLELERLAAEQQALVRSLQEDTTLNKAREEQQAAQYQLQVSLRLQEEAERALNELNTRLRALDQRLYSGMITNPKELNAVQQEAQHLRIQQNRQEELTLELMDATDTLNANVKQKKEARQQVEQARQQSNVALVARRDQLQRKQQEAQEKREQFAATINSELVKRYDMLRRSRQGRAVSRVEQQSCQWCRVILTPSELQHARASQELQTCSNCGRILYFDR